MPNVATIKFLYLCFAMVGIVAAYVFCKKIMETRIEGTLYGILCAISMMVFFERPFWFMTEQWVAAIVAVGFAFYVRNNLGTALLVFLLALIMKEMILLLILGGALAHLLLKRKDVEGNTLWIGAVVLGVSFMGLQGYFAQTTFLSAMRMTHEGSLRILHGFYPEDWPLVFSWFQFPSSPILLILATASLLTLRRHQALFLGGLLFGPILLIMTDPPLLVQVTGAKWALLSVLLQYMLWPIGVFALVRIRSLTIKRNQSIREYFWNNVNAGKKHAFIYNLKNEVGY